MCGQSPIWHFVIYAKSDEANLLVNTLSVLCGMMRVNVNQ